MSKKMKADEPSKFATANNLTSYIAGKKATKEGNTAVVVNLYNTVLQQQPNPLAMLTIGK